jgi:hypothetical protein
VVTAGQERRRAVRMLGALAGVLLLAGLLPWVTGGELVLRLLALPLLLAGLMVLGAALRVRAAVRAPAPSAPPVERGCDGCVCGISGGCGVAGPAGAQEPAPAQESAQASPSAG